MDPSAPRDLVTDSTDDVCPQQLEVIRNAVLYLDVRTPFSLFLYVRRRSFCPRILSQAEADLLCSPSCSWLVSVGSCDITPTVPHVVSHHHDGPGEEEKGLGGAKGRDNHGIGTSTSRLGDVYGDERCPGTARCCLLHADPFMLAFVFLD